MTNNEIRAEKFQELRSAFIKVLIVTTLTSLFTAVLTDPKPGWEVTRFLIAPIAIALIFGALAIYINVSYPKSSIPKEAPKEKTAPTWNPGSFEQQTARSERKVEEPFDALSFAREHARKKKEEAPMSKPAYVSGASLHAGLMRDKEAARRREQEEDDRLRRQREQDSQSQSSNLTNYMLLSALANSSSTASASPAPSSAPAESPPICRDDRVPAPAPAPEYSAPPAPAPTYDPPAPSPSYDSSSSSDSGSSSSSDSSW